MSSKYNSENYFQNRDARQAAMNKWISTHKDYLRDYHMKRYDEYLEGIGRTRRPKLTTEERKEHTRLSTIRRNKEEKIESRISKMQRLFLQIEIIEGQIEEVNQEIEQLKSTL